MTTIASRERGRYVATVRHHGADSAAAEQARRALALAKTETAIQRAIADAPPLDADTIAKLHSLIPAAPITEGGAAA